jgi:hypothetical protein
MSKNSKVPKFRDVKEEADFWDSHDITGYLKDLKPTRLVYKTKGEKTATVTVRVAPALKKELTRVAGCYDISPSALVRMWVVEKLRAAAC